MISKEIGNGFTLYIANSTSVGARNEQLSVNGIDYNVHLYFTVKDMILTETYCSVNRLGFAKDATYAQKRRISELVKRVVFDYLFSYPEVLKEADKEAALDKIRSLQYERSNLLARLAKIDAEIAELI